MKHITVSWAFVLAGLILGTGTLKAAPLGSCIFRGPGNTNEQFCTLIEDPGESEAPAMAFSLFAPDLKPGYWTVFESDGTVSDYVVFPNLFTPCSPFPTTVNNRCVANQIILYSNPFPPNLDLDGLVELGTMFEPMNDFPVFIITFDQKDVTDRFNDTFRIVSDPGTAPIPPPILEAGEFPQLRVLIPEPETFLLVGSVLAALGILRFRKAKA